MDCIDVHTHVVPENFPAYAGKGAGVPWPSMVPAQACHRHVMISGKVYRTVADGCWSVPRRLSQMGEMHISCQAISPMPELLSYWLPLDDAKAMVRYLNEQIAEMMVQAPGRFVGLGAVPLQDMNSALEELHLVMDTLKFAGVEIASHVNGVSIGDARFEPFFAEAARIGAAVFVHALRPAGQDRIVGAFPEQAVCFPGDIGLAAASMITGGIAARHPALRIAFSHGGGVMSVLLARLEHAWNTFPKAKESLTEPPSTTARRFYYDELVFSPRTIAFLVDTFGEDQIVLGTDYPFALGETKPLDTLAKAGLSKSVAAKITAANAKRFLALK
jgi:aminocarboxymuconate-semialdehyde decarboxylase